MTTQTLTLTEFLLARIGEDEAAGIDPYIWQYSPQRWAAECAAKRRIVERLTAPDPHGHDECNDCDTLYDLAAVYADDPECREEWKP